jgi:SAM-dependent methyltransferase
MTVNRRMWDESVPLHVASPDYDVPGFLEGRSTLPRLEFVELGPVRGRSLLHLQCHFGLDTLSWARRGARVTGVDFSPPAVREARRIAEEARLTARFLESNVYDLPRNLRGRFDIVYTGKGAICWLPDIPRWANVAAHFLRPGGRLYLIEDHPISDTFANERSVRDLRHDFPYFGAVPRRDESQGTYAAPEAKLRNALSFSWVHPVSEVLNALIEAGLRIEFVHEFPFSYWKKFPFMRRDRSGFWHLTRHAGVIPLMWSVRAVRPRSE